MPRFPGAARTYSPNDATISNSYSLLKILAIQFRYLGDAALMTPALRAIREHFPGCALHVLVAEEIAPLLQHLPGLARLWAFPRRRGKAQPALSWPVIRALRQERFDRSVDFGGNDRGAIISLLCGARERLGPRSSGGFLGRRFCYTHTRCLQRGGHQCLTNFQILSAWGIAAPACPRLEICADPQLAEVAAELLPHPAILCHLATSQPKKEWPLAHWVELYRRAAAAGLDLVFSTGITPREQALLADLKQRVPGIPVLPVLSDLPVFLAVLRRARLFISGDTGPLHFAAGLGVPTIGLFGPSPAGEWAPLGKPHRVLQADHCSCGGDTAVCLSANPCMAATSPDAVLRLMLEPPPGV
jgi:ADP-heptose:LPS heptosyltransferase